MIKLTACSTGATGFIGGEILYTVSHAHSDWEWTCLVRSQEKGAKVLASYPNIRLVYGDQDKADLIEEEASKADIIFHAAASDEHVLSAEAIVRGLRRRQSNRPSYYIHTSGALSLATETFVTGRFGDRFDKVYDDWENVGELTSFPDHTPHRKVDKVVLAASSDKIKTAIIAPSVIYGVGRGPDKILSFPLYKAFLKHQKIFGVGNGDNIWNTIHVQDLSDIYLRLAELAVNGKSPDGVWDGEGFYLAENGSIVFREILQLSARIAHEKGLIPSSDVVFLSPEEADKLLPYVSYVIGTTSRGKGLRAKKLLGWNPSMPSFEDEIGNTIDIEARRMGLS